MYGKLYQAAENYTMPSTKVDGDLKSSNKKKTKSKSKGPPPLMSSIKAEAGVSKSLRIGSAVDRVSSGLEASMERVERLRLQDEMEELKAKMADLEAENRDLAEEKQRADAMSGSAADESDALRRENVELKELIEKLKCDLQVQKDFCKQTKDDTARLEVQVADLSARLAAAPRSAPSGSSEDAALRKELEGYKQTAALDHKELQNLRAALAEEKQAKVKLGSLAKKKLQELQTKATNHSRALNKRLQNGSDQYKRVVRAEKAARERCAALSKQIEALQKEIANLTAKAKQSVQDQADIPPPVAPRPKSLRSMPVNQRKQRRKAPPPPSF